MRADKKRHPWPWWRRLVREVVWALDLDDGTGDGSASLTKVMALVAFLLAVVVILRALPVTGTQLTLVIIAISAAFGRSIWRAFLNRGSWSMSASDTTAKSEQRIRQEIVQRRALGAEDGSEPT